MNSKVIALACGFTLLLLSCGGSAKHSHESHDGEVYVCGGRYSKRYHNDEDCRGLRNCRGRVSSMSIEEAEAMGKTPCGYCY